MNMMYKATLYNLFILLLFMFNGVHAATVPAPPQVTASGHLLQDMDSGHVISEENADLRLEPASLTKIMTAYVVFRELAENNLKLTDEVLVSEKAWKTPGSRMFIEVNKKVTIDELLHGLVIQSGNDASVALAEHVAGSEDAFAGLMNKHSARLGMDNTHFMNATGLPDTDHYTTPRDILKVTKATIQEFPELYRLYAIKEYSFNKIKQPNRNSLLWRDESVDGVKTGHTEAAGYCLVASAKRDGMRLLSVVMGTDSENARARETQSLFNYGFRFYETHRLYGAGDTLSTVQVWKGAKEHTDIGLTADLYITIPRRQYDKLNARTVVNHPILAPIQKGSNLGNLIVELNGEQLIDRPLVSLDEVPEGNLWRTTIDSILLLLE